MTTYLAVVKYPLDAPLSEKRKTLLEGLGAIAMELVEEHDFSMPKIEEALEEAQMQAEEASEAKARREAKATEPPEASA